MFLRSGQLSPDLHRFFIVPFRNFETTVEGLELNPTFGSTATAPPNRAGGSIRARLLEQRRRGIRGPTARSM
jgi:hypothetical protein